MPPQLRTQSGRKEIWLPTFPPSHIPRHRTPLLESPPLSKIKECFTGKKIVHLASKYDADLQEAATMTKCAVRKQVRAARHDLWTAQKEATMRRVAWLEENAQNIAKAAGEIDWEKK